VGGRAYILVIMRATPLFLLPLLVWDTPHALAGG
jgi:hypothetical protein